MATQEVHQLRNGGSTDAILDADTVRQRFIDFFKSNGHEYVHSSPITLHEDPSLLFVNAGMNQYKSIFTGKVDPSSRFGQLKRAVNSQKCIRAGGKHNDLDDVGKDVYHHTFFEMLGNWSFGDYFKKEAIGYVVEFLTKSMSLDIKHMYATYFQGDSNLGIEPDFETRDIWLQYLAEDRVLPGSVEDNFWEMGDCGPCGPCTELHYDRNETGNAAHLVNSGDPNVLEVWNVVFIQFDRQIDGKLLTLPNKHVDTGMGLERLVSIVQRKMSNYDTDIFTPIFQNIQRISGFATPYQGKVGLEDDNQIDQAYRVVADHCRTLIVSIADGISPSNTGRGYVIRRILRRAIRFAVEKLEAKRGFMPVLVAAVIPILAKTFSEINSRIFEIVRIVRIEEAQFLDTLIKGRKYFDKIVKECLPQADSANRKVLLLPGEAAYKLHDTFGFPIDLTQIMCEERGLSLDMKEYESFKEAALNLSRQNKFVNRIDGTATNTASILNIDNPISLVNILTCRDIPLTNDTFKYKCYKPIPAVDPTNINYLFKPVYAVVVGIFDAKNNWIEQASSIPENTSHIIVLNQTCFYGMSGGQVSDTGSFSGENFQGVINDVIAFGGYVFHVAQITEGTMFLGDPIECEIDGQARMEIMANHTATHILNFALRNELGPSAQQMGSLVSRDKLRFDVSFQDGKISVNQIERIEEICQQYIKANVPVNTKELPVPEAMKIRNLRTLAGEDYPKMVRVVSLGCTLETGDLSNGSCITNDNKTGLNDATSESDEMDVTDKLKNIQITDGSVELCGGTHLLRTGHCGQFFITDVEPLSKGVRRFTAVTRDLAHTVRECSITSNALIDEITSLQDRISAMTANDLKLFNAKIKNAQESIDKATLPFIVRNRLQSKLAAVRSSIVNRSKGMATGLADKTYALLEEKIKAKAISYNNANNEGMVCPSQCVKKDCSGGDCFISEHCLAVVGHVSLGVDKKMLGNLTRKLCSTFPNLAILLVSQAETDSCDENSSIRSICQANVPKNCDACGNLRADKWINEVSSTILSGKHGGSSSSAQLQSPDTLVDSKHFLDVASTFAQSAMSCSEGNILQLSLENINEA